MQCGKCREEAVTFQQYSGMHLCRRHFIEDIEAKAKHVIRSNRWLSGGDHIGVDVAGNTNGTALLFFLHRLLSNRKDIRITAIILDTSDENPEMRDYAVKLAEKLGIPVIRGSPAALSDAVRDEGGSGTGTPGDSCNEALRQVILDRVGKEHGMTKIATGHNLDEEAVSVLTAMLHGESGRIFTETQEGGRGLIPVITPFIAISEDDIAFYASQQGLEPAGSRPCVPDAFGNEVKTMLEVYTQRHPATKYSLLHLGENIRNAGATGMFRDEESCGDKTDRDSSHQCGTQGKVN